MGWELLSPLDCYRQLWRVIQLKPELVVYAVNPFDLSRDIDPNQLVHRNERVLPRRASTPVVEDRGQALRDTLKFIQNSLADSRAFTIAQHFLFSNPDTFLRIYLADGDRADYVRQPFTNLWQQRFTNFNLIVGEMAARLKKAGIPFVIISLPARAQVAMVEKGHYPRHTDPFAFDREIQKICQDAGVTLCADARSIQCNSERRSAFLRCGHAYHRHGKRDYRQAVGAKGDGRKYSGSNA